MAEICGCGNTMHDKEIAKKLLEEKYGQTFEVETIVETRILDEYYTALAYPSDDPDLLFKVSVSADGQRETDNYVSKCVFKKLADLVGKNLDNLNGYFYIYCTPLVERTGFTDPEMEVEEYLEQVPNGKINIYLHYAPDQMDAENLYHCLQNVYKGIGNEDMEGMIYLFIVDENGLDTAQDYLESHDQIYVEYRKKMDSYYKGYVKIVAGKPDCSKDEFVRKVGDEH